MREDLYEQCSFHIAEKMPSSVKVGSRPISFRMRSYSSGLSPWAATSSGVILGSFFMDLGFRQRWPLLGTSGGLRKALYGAFSRCPTFCGRRLRERELHSADGSDLRAKDPQLKAHFLARIDQSALRPPPRPPRRHRGRIPGLANLDSRQFRDPYRAVLAPDRGRRQRAMRVPGREKAPQRLRNVHGGCFMAFADYCLFAIATHVLEGRA